MKTSMAEPLTTSPAQASQPRVLRPRRAAPADAVRPTRAEVNLANLRHNLRVVQRAAKGARVWGVLKADAYGHGAPAVARTLERAGIDGLCVALLEEAIELREAGIGIPVLVMGGYYGNAWDEILDRSLVPVVYDAGQIEGFARQIRYRGCEPVGVHVKIDTGMARLGCTLGDLPELVAAFARFPEVRLDGLMTHLACADAGDFEATEAQLALFNEATRLLASAGLVPKVRHAANSAAVLRSESALFDAVRPGIALFGVSPQQGLSLELRPILKVRTEIAAVREVAAGAAVGYGWTWRAERPSRIATIPMGYADGLSRQLSNRGHVLVRGKRAPIVGAVSMDLTMIDVTDLPGASLRDEAVVLGPQEGPLGRDTIGCDEVAAHTSSIPWEVLTSISRRVPRFYREP